MKSASEFRSSKSEAENRMVKVGRQMNTINLRDDTSLCFNCGSMEKLRRGDIGQLYLPLKCVGCEILYNRKFQFCIPDIILSAKEGSASGVVFVNEDETHGKNRIVDKDRTQIQLLREMGFAVFVISDQEIYSMTDSSLRLWLYGAAQSLRSAGAAEAMYRGEKEYRCLRPS